LTKLSKMFWRQVWMMALRTSSQAAFFQACSACSACHFSKWAQNLQELDKLWELSTFNHRSSLVAHRPSAKNHWRFTRSHCGVAQSCCAQGAGSDAKKSGPYGQVRSQVANHYFWQAVWANIWCAILAGSWPSLVRVPLGERGPVPEVLLSRLPLIFSSNQCRKSDYTLLPYF
jgi:hypothetical protein